MGTLSISALVIVYDGWVDLPPELNKISDQKSTNVSDIVISVLSSRKYQNSRI